MGIANYLLSWDGRIGRLQWWLGGLAQAVILIVAGVLFTAGVGGNFVFLALSALLLILALWFGIGLSVKRLHDHNKSGFWFFVYFIPIAGLIWQLIECGLMRGTEGDNDYGPDSRFRFNVSEDIAALVAQRDREVASRQPSAMRPALAMPSRLAPADAARTVFGKRV